MYYRVQWALIIITLLVAFASIGAALKIHLDQKAACKRGDILRANMRSIIQLQLLAIVPASTRASDPELRYQFATIIPILQNALHSKDLQSRCP